MRVNYLILLLLLSFQSLSAATPQIEFWQSRKGAKVYFVEIHQLPIVDIQILFDGGSARDPLEKKGLAMFTAGLLDEGAGGMDANEISYEFERLGAVYGANASYDSATITLRSLAQETQLKPALANLKRVISAPDFPAKAIDRQRNRILIGLQRKQQSPGALAKDAFFAALYGKHPYAFPNEGTQDSIKSLQRKDIVDFYKDYYTVRNATIAIVGDLDIRRAKRLVEDLTRSLKKGRQAKPLPAVNPVSAGREIRISFPSMQTHVMLGQTGMKRNDPDYFPLYVGNHVLGGGGMVSRLYEEIREKRGLAYSVYSYFSPMRELGPFTAGLQTRAGQADQALGLLRENLEKYIAEGPTEEELEASKKNITGGFPLRLDSNRDILGYVGMIGYYNLSLTYLDDFTANVEAVTLEQIRDAFRRRLSPGQMTAILVGPGNKTAEEGN